MRNLAAEHNEIVDRFLYGSEAGRIALLDGIELFPDLRERECVNRSGAVVERENRPLLADRTVGARLRHLYRTRRQGADHPDIKLFKPHLIL